MKAPLTESVDTERDEETRRDDGPSFPASIGRWSHVLIVHRHLTRHVWILCESPLELDGIRREVGREIVEAVIPWWWGAGGEVGQDRFEAEMMVVVRRRGGGGCDRAAGVGWARLGRHGGVVG